MKIIILVNRLTGGGAERVAALWANGFSKRGHDVVIIINDDKSPHTYSLNSEIRIICVPIKKSRIGFVRVINRILKLRYVLTSEAPDIVIDVMPSWKKLAAMIGLSFIRIATEHNSFERPENAEVKVNKFEKFYLNRLYDHVTVLTQADKDVVGSRLKNVTVMPNPLALELATTVPEKQNVVLAVGRLDAWYVKGFDILIKAWANIVDKADGWKLQIVGGGKDKSLILLRKLCNELHVEDTVVFTGFKSNIQPIFQNASIFVLSSRYEGFGLVLIEAMSQGCACIACDYKGRQREIITNVMEGEICQPDDANLLASKITLLINDESRRRRIQENSIRKASDFSVENIMEKWDKIFDNFKI